MNWLVVILGLALLMVVHETGHLLAARAFGMRVVTFSIGFGPALWRHQPRGSETIYQVALIPFLAYVQIAGMDPFEEVDPEDRSSYANAGLFARIMAIFAGPLANYLFASVFFFGAFMLGGNFMVGDITTRVDVQPGGAAERAGMIDGDRIVRIGSTPIDKFDQLRKKVLASPGKPIQVEVRRAGAPIMLEVTPEAKGDSNAVIGVIAMPEPMPVSEALKYSVIYPAQVVKTSVVEIAHILTGQTKAELMGPVGIVKESKRAVDRGWSFYLMLLGILSAYLGAFNLVPFPALDGGRLVFLGYEAVTRRRPNQKIEANIHRVGLLMLLALILVVSIFDITGR